MENGQDRRVVLIEFNELCPSLLEKWMGEGLLPNFKTFHDSSNVFVSVADTTDPKFLEPWIQWYSLHTGLSYQSHKVFHLTDGPRQSHLDIWHFLSDLGYRTGNFSSMNARAVGTDGNFFLPDPWCTSETPNPPELAAYFRVVSTMVKEYSSGSTGLTLKDYLRFGYFLMSHGIRIRTIFELGTHLLAELFTRKRIAWRRASMLDKIQFDLFRHYFHKNRPHFATFFSNSTAHYQHGNWRSVFPEQFGAKQQPDNNAGGKKENQILYGYQQMDRLLGDFFRLEADDVTLVLATALSQQAFLKYEHIGGQHFYRLREPKEFLKKLGIRFTSLMPVMTHQYLIHFSNDEDTHAARTLLSNIQIDGQPVFGFSESEPLTLYFGCQIKVANALCLPMSFGPETGSSQNLGKDFYQIEGVKSGCHHPDGAFWIKTGKHMAPADKISILDVAPTLLTLMGMPEQKLPAAFEGKPVEFVS